jgi:hypothetical protein
MRYTYYQFDARRLTLAELWRGCGNLLEFLVAAFCKSIRVNMSPLFGIARTDRLVRIVASAVPEFAKARMSPLIQQAEALGMVPGFYFTIPTVGAMEGYCFAMRSADGQVALSIDCIRIVAGPVVNDKATFYFCSKLHDGDYLITSGSKREENMPSGYDGRYFPGRPISDVLQHHRQQLAERRTRPQVMADAEELERRVFEYERGVMDFQIERRVLVPLPADEVQRLKNLPRPADVSSGSAQPSRSQPGLRWLEWGCWFALLFGIYLFSKGSANSAQVTFRLALLGAGLIGVILFQIARLLRSR